MKRALILTLVLSLLLLALPAHAQTDDAVTEGILDCFAQLAAIPRPSHHEEKISAFLYQWALERGFEAQRDEAGNVVFDVPATEGCEHAPIVALQAHMDMVAVSDDPDFDPLNTPVKLIREGNTLTADGTSLGADDGIGVAAIMYYVTSPGVHGPLRVILTVNEEDGMSGVNGLSASVMEGVEYLINLDAETIGEAIISSAAGFQLKAEQQPRRVAPTLDAAISIELYGLQGGHSGVLIGAGRINAITNLADLLLHMRESGVAYELDSFEGGTAHNAIPSDSLARIVIDAKDKPRVETLVEDFIMELAEAYSHSDAGLTAEMIPVDLPNTVFEQSQADQIIDYAALVFDGLHTMSQAVNGLVESSSNLGVFYAGEDEITSTLFARSSQAALLDSIRLKQSRLAELLGFTAAINIASEAWPVNVNSRLSAIAQEVYLEQTGSELKLACIHAGLECGSFLRMNKRIDLLSIGPEIHDVHSVNETVYIDTIAPFYRLFEGILIRLGNTPPAGAAAQ